MMFPLSADNHHHRNYQDGYKKIPPPSDTSSYCATCLHAPMHLIPSNLRG
jgi:hypothetical protein